MAERRRVPKSEAARPLTGLRFTRDRLLDEFRTRLAG